MQTSLSFIRLLFLCLSILFSTIYFNTYWGANSTSLMMGMGIGCGFGLLLIAIERSFKVLDLRTLNIITFGLFFGYLLGEALFTTFHAAFDLGIFNADLETTALIRLSVFLLTAYLGMSLTARAADKIETWFSSFRKETPSASSPMPSSETKKEILLDATILSDSRLFDLATSGLVDQQLVIPRFVINELQFKAESEDENVCSKARKSIDAVKKLEMLPGLNLRYEEFDCAPSKDPISKLLDLASHLKSSILTTDGSRFQLPGFEHLRIININVLALALKPSTQAGEYITIKIQRYGKEPRQGVGYREDGTMVVVNGGAAYIGETIKALVLSVKHTASGRMVFCNALEERAGANEEMPMDALEPEGVSKGYFAL